MQQKKRKRNNFIQDLLTNFYLKNNNLNKKSTIYSKNWVKLKLNKKSISLNIQIEVWKKGSDN